jgi:hypothetical protein
MHSGIHCSCKQELDGKEMADPALFWWLVGWFNTLLFSQTDWFLTHIKSFNFSSYRAWIKYKSIRHIELPKKEPNAGLVTSK